MTTTLEPTREIYLPDGTWSIDPQRSEVGFAVKEMWGLRTVRGVFRTFDCNLKVRAKKALGELAIDAASLGTGNRRRDRHLRSSAFFDVERHPSIVFKATTSSVPDGQLAFAGELRVRDARVRLEVPAAIERLDDGAIRLHGVTQVSRTAAGLHWNLLGMISDEAVLHAKLTLERTTPDAVR